MLDADENNFNFMTLKLRFILNKVKEPTKGYKDNYFILFNFQNLLVTNVSGRSYRL